MSWSRREMCAVLGMALLALGKAGVVAAQSGAELDPAVADMVRSLSAPDMPLDARGLGQPTPQEDAHAREMLAGAPQGPCHPLVIAQWFLTQDNDDITQTLPGQESRANPVIIRFFTEATTLRKTDGDETWWCAAFANWCLMRAKQDRTRDARSSSFREWKDAVNEPARPGDLVIYQNVTKPDHGHVGFFLGYDERGLIRTLAGNQTDGGRPTICVRPFHRVSSTLKLLSFRRDPSWPALP